MMGIIADKNVGIMFFALKKSAFLTTAGCSQGVSLVNQHKMVTRALSDQIKDMHGLTVKTSVPK